MKMAGERKEVLVVAGGREGGLSKGSLKGTNLITIVSVGSR